MKISVLTPTYNRAELLKRLYESIIKQEREIQVEWLIMDDGSTDNTKNVINSFKLENKIEIQYFYQENSGKMNAINNLVPKAKGNVIIECDSDDFFTDEAFNIIGQAFHSNENRDDLYAICFLKYDLQGKNIGKKFKEKETTMFDLYFKQGEDGEKALVYFSDIRKQYKYKLEKKERFCTEARLHHEMDLKYKIICYDEPIMVCEYQKDGYTRNIQKIFKENPYGYYKYFKEILERDMKGVSFKKRLYVIKHYILFSYLTKQYNSKSIKNFKNKVVYYILLLPGMIKSNIKIEKNKF